MHEAFFYKPFSTINLKCIALVGESDQTCHVAAAAVIIVVILVIVIIIVPNLGKRM